MFANQESKSHKSQKILARHKPSVNRICSRTHWQHQLELGERGLPGLGYGGSAFLGHLFVNDLVGEAVDGLVRQSGTGRAVTLQRLEAVHLESILILKDFFNNFSILEEYQIFDAVYFNLQQTTKSICNQCKFQDNYYASVCRAKKYMYKLVGESNKAVFYFLQTSFA